MKNFIPFLAGCLCFVAACNDHAPGVGDSAKKNPAAVSADERTRLSDVEVIKYDSSLVLAEVKQPGVKRTEEKSGPTVIEVFFNPKDSVTTKFFRDQAGVTYSLTKEKNGVRLHAAEYYANGQLKARVSYVNGELDGPARYFYEDGRVRSEGAFRNGNHWGRWKNYDESGKLVSVEEYDEDGQTDKAHEVK